MKTKEELIEDFLKEPIKVGDNVTVRGLGIQDKSSWGSTTKVVELGEECSDEDAKAIFLNVNFTGVQMSQENIEFVKSVNL